MIRTGERGALPESAPAAIVVAFKPEAAQLARLLDVLLQDCRIVWVMDNGGAQPAIAEGTRASARLRLVDMEGNRGIAAALNRGFQLAKAAGVQYVATFDQDSNPAPGMLPDLARAHELLVAAGSEVAAVGPRIVDVRIANRLSYPFMRRRFGWPTAISAADRESLAVDYLITSGCLISMQAFDAVGPFAEAFFVDCIDMEWCFRAASKGYSVYGIASVDMPHEVGTGEEARAFGLTILGHSPTRRYYYARNTIFLLKRRYVAVGWKARMLLGLIGRTLVLPVAFRFGKGWPADWLMLIRGIGDGIAGIGGACRFET